MSQELNAELREFLRSRRAKITPDQAGLPPQPGGRRVPGLRREEVAQLAGVSVDYYIRLERGRHSHVSESVLDAIARALRLNDLERAHLFQIARPSHARPRSLPPQHLRPGLQLMVDTLIDVPVVVVGRRLDVLASNRLARALYTDFEALPAASRNMAWLIFLDKKVRALFADWEENARGTVAALRLYAGREPHDPALAELVAELSLHDPDFRRWWADHDVFQRTHGMKRFRHTLIGDLVLGYETFTATDDPYQMLGIYTAEPGSTSADRLKLLASWSATAHQTATTTASSEGSAAGAPRRG
jgi:transcriptional regulator with XRE-family HTH domain